MLLLVEERGNALEAQGQVKQRKLKLLLGHYFHCEPCVFLKVFHPGTPFSKTKSSLTF